MGPVLRGLQEHRSDYGKVSLDESENQHQSLQNKPLEATLWGSAFSRGPYLLSPSPSPGMYSSQTSDAVFGP